MPVLMLEAAAPTPLGAALLDALKRQGIAMDRVLGRVQFTAALERSRYLCVLLDLGARDDDLDSALDAILSHRPELPLIAVARRDGAAERIAWLQRGADDVVSADVQTDELVARIGALTRRARSRTDPRPLVHGPLALHPERRAATWRGEAVALTGGECALLECLVRGARQAHTRDALHAALNAERAAPAASNTVDVHVHALRRKLHPQLIRTVRGIGYRIADAEVFER